MDLWHAHASAMAIQLLACSAKSWPSHSSVTLTLSPRRGPVHDLDVDAHIGRKSMFLTSKAFVTSFLTSLSMRFFSLLSLAHEQKTSVSFKAKLQPFFSPHVKNESIRKTGSYKKRSSKILHFVAVALYMYITACLRTTFCFLRLAR